MIEVANFVTVIYFIYRPTSWSVAQPLPVHYDIIISAFTIAILKRKLLPARITRLTHR